MRAQMSNPAPHLTAATQPPPPALADLKVFHKEFDWPKNLPVLPKGFMYSDKRTTLIAGNREPRPRQVSSSLQPT